jgi:hypothetical protein
VRSISSTYESSRCIDFKGLTILLKLLTEAFIATRRFPIRQLILPFYEGHWKRRGAEIENWGKYRIRVRKVVTEFPGRFGQDGLDQGVKRSTGYSDLRSLLPLPEVTDLVLLTTILSRPTARNWTGSTFVLYCACRIPGTHQEDVLGNASSGHTTSRIDSIHGSFPLASSCATAYGDVSSDKLNAVSAD